jgi:CheY-like chemotaxis protein
MPGMDGIEAVNIIRGINSEYAKTIPIIALTANAIIGNEEMFLNNGFQAFLPKPADPVRLNHIIRKWIMNEELIEHNQLSSHPAQCAHQLSTVNICGVNSETALYLFEGDVEMYKKFLRSFADYIPSETKKINNVSESNLKEYAGVVHTIKGACAGIGANELADYADRLVKLARKDDITGVIGENEKFIKEMNVLFNNVGMFLKS